VQGLPPPVRRRLINKLLLERISLCGICRVVGVSLRWLLSFLIEIYQELPDDLNLRLPGASKRGLYLCKLEAEADEMWSFVGSKANKQWIAINTETGQIIAFFVGDRSRESARKL
jgi:insertion element IS1 protein InsB